MMKKQYLSNNHFTNLIKNVIKHSLPIDASILPTEYELNYFTTYINILGTDIIKSYKMKPFKTKSELTGNTFIGKIRLSYQFEKENFVRSGNPQYITFRIRLGKKVIMRKSFKI